MSHCKQSATTTGRWFTALVLSAALAGCGGSSDGDDNNASPTTPVGAGTGVGGAGHGPTPVSLGGASPFVILTKSGVTNIPTSVITGNVGTSGITSAAIGVTCAEVTGIIYSFQFKLISEFIIQGHATIDWIFSCCNSKFFKDVSR